MGGDAMPSISFESEEDFPLDPDFPRPSSCSPCYFRDKELIFGDFDEFGLKHSVESSNCAADHRRRDKVYREVLQGYDQLARRTESLKEAKSRILGYAPGAWIEKAGSIESRNYDVPKTTSLILIGPKGSGKSSLINRITRVIECDQFAPDRAQVSYNSSSGEGTFFLHEYMIPRGSSSFCLYDTRGYDGNYSDYINTIKQWITHGIRHGELIMWKSDSLDLRDRLKQKACGYTCQYSETRRVNYVILVVSGVEVLKSMDAKNPTGGCYTQMVAAVFNSPHVSFKDDKPAVVITHGDLLSVAERAQARVHLGELLGIPPDKQIFDIPESCDPSTELRVVDMLRYSLEHADKSVKILPRRNWVIDKVLRVVPAAFISLVIVLGVALILGHMEKENEAHARRSEPQEEILMDWGAIRSMWL